VFNLGDHIAIGYCGSFRMGQILRYHLAVDPPLTELRRDDAFQWAVETLIPAVRDAFKENGWSRVKEGVEQGGHFLVAVRDRLLQIESDFQVAEPGMSFDAVGSGDLVAFGVLAALLDDQEAPTLEKAERAALKALEISETFTPTVRGPFQVVTTKP
jgi:ATP-dependent protease HslVU (ClpYQ) peptidase subunit